MTKPQGFEDSQFSYYLCKLNKSIYGLKHAPSTWFTLFVELVNLGFNKSKVDPSLFIRVIFHSTTYLLIYMDDIIVTGSNDDEIQVIIATLNSKFDLKYLGLLSYFLRIDVSILPNGDMMVNQSKYIKELLAKKHME